MLVSINGVDLTPYINTSSYDVNEEALYESWLDGNSVEHRIYTRRRVKGKFDVVLYGLDGMTTSRFMEVWEGGVSNNTATIIVYVQNTNTEKPISAYFEFKGNFHRKMINGQWCDKLTINIRER